MAFTLLQSATGTDSVTFGTSPSAGELLVLAIHLESDSDLSNVTPPSGFVVSGSYVNSQRTIGVYTKTAEGTEGALTFTHSTSASVVVVGRRFSVGGSFTIIDSANADATNTTSITVGPLTASSGDLLLAFAAQDGAASTVSWSDSFIDEISQSLGSHTLYGTYKVSSGASESTTRTLSSQVVRQSAVMILVEESGSSLSITDPIVPGTATTIATSGNVDPWTGARITDSAGNVKEITLDSQTAVSAPALGTQAYCLFGSVTLEVYNATESATAAATFNPPAAYAYLVTLPVTPSNLTDTGYLHNWSPENGYEGVQVIAEFEIDNQGNVVFAEDDAYLLYSIDDFDGAMQAFAVTISDGQVVPAPSNAAALGLSIKTLRGKTL